MADKIEVKVTMKNIYKYTAPAFGYGLETRFIYTMTGEDGTEYVWKTGSWMGIDNIPVNKGDAIRIKATIKGIGEYKGMPQTELMRVKVLESYLHTKTYEELKAEREAEEKRRREEQLESIGEDDIVWQMPYRQYKEHYADCETVIGSYKVLENRSRTKVITVIIRHGRLKASGVRGEHYSGYEIQFTDTDGKVYKTVYRAVKEENAIRRFSKDFPEAQDISITHIYHYGA